MKIASNYQILPLLLNKTNQKYSLNKNNLLKDTISFTRRIEDDFTFFNRERMDNEADDIKRTDMYQRIDSRMSYRTIELTAVKNRMGIENAAQRQKALEDWKFEYWMAKNPAPIDRLFSDLKTLGANELFLLNYRLESRFNAKKWVQKAELMRIDLLNAKAQEETMELLKQKDEIKAQAKHIADFTSIQNGEIYPKLFDKIQAKKEGMDVEVPNCVMVANENEEINEEIIDWILQNANANVSELNAYDCPDWDRVFEKAQEKYRKTGKWNIIHVKDLDKLINPKIADSSDIAMMKSVMGDSAKYYHTTLLFSSTNPDELDETATETYRVQEIKTDGFKTIKQIIRDYAKERLQDEEYVKNTPLSAINDLVDLTGIPERHKLDFSSTRNNMEKTVKKIQEKLTKEQSEKYENVLNLAQESAWYCVDEEGRLRKIKQPLTHNKRNMDGLMQVVGMHSLKEDLYDLIIAPVREQGADSISGGFLLYGPQNCGKAFIAQRLANELERKCVEISPSTIGGANRQEILQNIKDKFEEAKNEAPSMLLISDIDAIAPSKDSISVSEGIELKEQVEEIISEVDSCDGSNILLVCTSSKPQNIDSELKKTGRFDKKIFVSIPDERTRRIAVMEELDKIRNKDIIDIDLIAAKTKFFTVSDIKTIFERALLKASDLEINLNTDLLYEEVQNYTPAIGEDSVDEYLLRENNI